jgi:TP901 family phage tail tape measure protein
MAINLPIVSKYDDSGVKSAEASLAGFGKIVGGLAAAATAAVTGIAVKSISDFAKFDEKLNQSVAIMGDVSEAMRGDMADAARTVAKETTFSADQAAESFFFLASAGLDAEASIAAMPQVAKFAQAGMFDMATATDLATDAQSALGLGSKDAEENLANLTRVTDVFVRANTLANTSVEQLATAFTTKAGTALKTVGKDVEEGAAALALFADQGVKGEIAGTQLTNTIFGLTDRALKAPEAFDKLGISVFDTDGKMRNFADIADDLGGAFEGMTEEQKLAELGALGFSKQARAGVLMLTGQGDKIREYETALRDAAGFTEDVAAKQLLTPTAQFALLGSAMNDVSLEIGSVLGPALGNMAQALLPLIESLLPKITTFLEEKVVPAVENFSQVFINGATGLADGSLTIQEIFENLFDKILEFFTGGGLTKLLEGFIAIRGAIIDALIKLIPMVVGVLVEMLPVIVDTIAKMLPTILDQAVETFNALVEAIVVVLPMLLKALLDMLPDIIESIISMLPKIVESAITLFTGLVTAVIEVVPQLIQAIIDALPQIIDALIDALPQIIEAGFTLFTGLATALYRAFPDIVKSLLELLPQIIETILGLVPKLISAGFELVKGLAKGMIDNIPKLLGEAANAIGGALTNGVKAVFQIKSPSRVFMDIGENVVTGLEEGITDNLRQLENASIGMASTVTATAENNMSGLSAPMPILGASQGSSGGMTLNLTVNAGMGADGADIGRKIVDEILRFERSSGKVFARA